MDLSVIIPVLNEKESLPILLEEIKTVCGSSSLTYEIIVVDDGSRDGTFEWLRQVSEKDPHVQGVRFRHNCGKAAALSMGFKLAKGEYVITMDGDLQDNPAEIPDILEMLKNDADMVSGWKKKRYDPLHKTVPSKFFNAVVRLFSGLKLHDFNCGLKGYRREVAKSLNLYGELHRFIPVIAHWNTFTVKEKTVEHRARQHGRSKYGLARFSNGLFDLITLLFLHRYTSRPLHLFGFVGLCFNGFGAGVLCYFGVTWLITRELHIRPLLLGAIAAILLGVQIISLGLLAEMIAQRSESRYPISGRTSGIDEIE